VSTVRRTRSASTSAPTSILIDPFGLVPLKATGYSLYHILDGSGNVRYVGITNNPHVRELDHIRSGRIAGEFHMEVQETGNLTYAQARGYEQADIAHFGTRDTSRIGEEIVAGDGNRIWSYATHRRDRRARAFRRHEAARRRARAGGGCS